MKHKKRNGWKWRRKVYFFLNSHLIQSMKFEKNINSRQISNSILESFQDFIDKCIESVNLDIFLSEILNRLSFFQIFGSILFKEYYICCWIVFVCKTIYLFISSPQSRLRITNKWIKFSVSSDWMLRTDHYLLSLTSQLWDNECNMNY